MIANDIVKEQLQNYLQAVMPMSDIKIPPQQVSIDAAAVVKLVEDSMTKLRDLIDTESKKMVVTIAKDSSIAFDSLLRVFISYCHHPDQEIDVQRIDSCYENYKNSFAEKYRSFFSCDFMESETAFLSMTSTLEELKAVSKQLADRLSELSTSKLENTTQSGALETEASKSKVDAGAQDKKKTSDQSGKPTAGLISRWLSKLKGKDDGYHKTDLGKDSSGMQWDPVKKKYALFFILDGYSMMKMKLKRSRLLKNLPK